MMRNGKEWLTAGLILLGLGGAIFAYDHAADVRVKEELVLAAAVLLGATAHLALAHVQGRIAPLHGAMVFSLAVVGIVAGVVGVVVAALTNDDATTLGLAVAGLGGAVAGAETLTRVATRSLGAPAVSKLSRTGKNLELTGHGLAGIQHVMIGDRQVAAQVSGDRLTATIPDGATAGAVLSVGSGDGAAQLALPAG